MGADLILTLSGRKNLLLGTFSRKHTPRIDEIIRTTNGTHHSCPTEEKLSDN